MSEPSLKIIAWNIHHGGADRVSGIVDFLCNERPDVIVLTEYRPTHDSGRRLRDLLRARRWPHLEQSPHIEDCNAILIASRTPLAPIDSQLALDLPSDALAKMHARWIEVRVPAYTIRPSSSSSAPVPFTIAGVHIPGSTDGLGSKGKRAFWQALLDMASNRSSTPLLLAGDFNTGLGIDQGGATPFHGQEHIKRLRDELGWQDAWRSQHEAIRDYTWFSHAGSGYRVDHAWLSPTLQGCLIRAEHLHDVRTSLALSDHSALMVELRAQTITA